MHKTSPHRRDPQPPTAKNSANKPRARQQEMQSTILGGRDTSNRNRNRSRNMNSNVNLNHADFHADPSSTDNKLKFQASLSESKLPNKPRQGTGFEYNYSQPVSKNGDNGNGILRGNKTSISPFDIGQDNKDIRMQIQVLDPKRQQKQYYDQYLQKIKHINSDYITLLHTMAKQNIPPLQLKPQPSSQAPSQPSSQPFNPNRMPRNQRYQYECLKLLHATTQMVGRMREIRELQREWEMVEEIGREIGIGMVGNGAVTQGQVVQRIMERYIGLEKQVQLAQQQYDKLAQIPNSSNCNANKSTPLTQLQKSYKHSQRKLSKIMSQQLQYQKKCTQYQQKLQTLHLQVKKVQQDRLNIQMKIIADTSRNQRLARKKREAREKDRGKEKEGGKERDRDRSVKDYRQRQRQREKVEDIGLRAKSAIRFFMH